jgi:RNAse (barnase) inhibitor barstar
MSKDKLMLKIMSEIVIDASLLNNTRDFYNAYCRATEAPRWFGNNLDAFRDSLRGEICKITPVKIIIRNLSRENKEKIGNPFWKSITDICTGQDVILEVYTE